MISANSRLFAVLLLFVMLFISACGSLPANQVSPTLIPNPVSITKPTYEVQLGEVTKTIQLNGRVTPVTQENLFFRVDGTVKDVLVKIGDNVNAGDVLARLDEPERYLADISSAQLALTSAIKERDQVRIISPINLIEAEASLASAQRALDSAMQSSGSLAYYLDHPLTINGKTFSDVSVEYEQVKSAYDEKSKAYDAGVLNASSDAELAEILREMSAAYQQLQVHTNQMAWLTDRTSQLQNKLDTARAKVDAALLEVARWTMSDPNSDFALAELKVQDAQARLDLANLSLESNEIKAGMDGQVTSLAVTTGSQVKAFQVVATVADLNDLELTAIPKADDITLLGIGQSATVKMNTAQGDQYEGVIIGLPIVAGSQTAADQSVHFQITTPGSELQAGATATILVSTQSKANVLWLPPAAIRTYQGESYVLVQEGDVVRRVNIILGLQTPERFEIVTGLEVGQKVIGQ